MKQSTVKRKIFGGDLDPLGVVFYPRYYEWIDACSQVFFESIGLNMVDLERARKITFGLEQTSCRYHCPGRCYQEIEIITHINGLTKKMVNLKHTIRRVGDNALMVEGFEKRNCVDISDPENLQSIDIPEDIYETLKEAAGK